MFKHYLTSAWRFLSRFRTHTLLNAIGLSVGIASCGLILLFVRHELQSDRQYPDAQCLYRVTSVHNSDRGVEHSAAAYAAAAELLRLGIPSVSVSRVFSQNLLFTREGLHFQEDAVFLVDREFPQMFGLHLIEGDPGGFDRPNTMLLTTTLAQKYFPAESAVGKTIRLENKVDVTIVGVIPDAPAPSHMRYSALVNFQVARDLMGDWIFHAWHWPPVHIYLKRPLQMSETFLQSEVARTIKAGLPEKTDFEPRLQRVVDIHLHSNLQDELQPNGSFEYVAIMSAAAILLLLLAIINFGNLSAALYSRRTKEVGIRKVVGAGRRQLVTQFTLESVLIVVLILPLSWMLAEWALPVVSRMAGRELLLHWQTDGLSFLLMALFATWAGMIYPSLLLSGVHTFAGLTETSHRQIGPRRLRRFLMVGQFAASLAFVFGAFVIADQMELISTHRLGFDREGLIVVPLRDEDTQYRFESAKTRLQEEAGVLGISALSNLPWQNGFYGFPVRSEGSPDQAKIAGVLMGDEDIVSTLKLELVEGRDLNRSDRKKSEAAFLINQAASKQFAWEVGSRITVDAVASGRPVSGQIVGVVSDFNLRSYRMATEPVVILVAPEAYYLDNFVIRLRTADLTKSLKRLGEAWNDIIPARPFEYHFVEDAIASLYQKDRQLLEVVRTFAVLLMVLACLGLVGMTGIELQRRTREIGIRKVMGAGPATLIRLLLTDTTRVVVLGSLIGFLAAYVLTNRWLDNFSIKTSVSPVFILSVVLVALVVAWLTVSAHVWRAISIDPVKTLSSE